MTRFLKIFAILCTVVLGFWGLFFWTSYVVKLVRSEESIELKNQSNNAIENRQGK